MAYHILHLSDAALTEIKNELVKTDNLHRAFESPSGFAINMNGIAIILDENEGEQMGVVPGDLPIPGQINPAEAPFLEFEHDHRSNKGLHELYVRSAYDDLKTIRACVNKLFSRSRWPATFVANELWQSAQRMIRQDSAWHDAAALIFARLPAPPERARARRVDAKAETPVDGPIGDVMTKAPEFVRRVGEDMQRIDPPAEARVMYKHPIKGGCTATWRDATPLAGKGWYDDESGEWAGEGAKPRYAKPEPAEG